MIGWIREQNDTDENGNPAGGVSYGRGLFVQWQDGPLGRGAERQKPNGAFVETVIAVAMRRLKFYQGSKFACEENQRAIEHLYAALEALNERTNKREQRQVEGTHAV